MTVTSFDPNAPVTLTAAALRHFEKALQREQRQLVRLSIEKNGCSGYGYVLALADTAEAGDTLVAASDSVTLAIAADAVDILRGTEIDMVTEGVNRVIKYNNPNVAAECGCGESFSVK
ncbi:MAG TPA: iron-sulfur cluster assembly accessory protein [Pseudomonadales bacterium]